MVASVACLAIVDLLGVGVGALAQGRVVDVERDRLGLGRAHRPNPGLKPPKRQAKNRITTTAAMTTRHSSTTVMPASSRRTTSDGWLVTLLPASAFSWATTS